METSDKMMNCSIQSKNTQSALDDNGRSSAYYIRKCVTTFGTHMSFTFVEKYIYVRFQMEYGNIKPEWYYQLHLQCYQRNAQLCGPQKAGVKGRIIMPDTAYSTV